MNARAALSRAPSAEAPWLAVSRNGPSGALARRPPRDGGQRDERRYRRGGRVRRTSREYWASIESIEASRGTSTAAWVPCAHAASEGGSRARSASPRRTPSATGRRRRRSPPTRRAGTAARRGSTRPGRRTPTSRAREGAATVCVDSAAPAAPSPAERAAHVACVARSLSRRRTPRRAPPLAPRTCRTAKRRIPTPGQKHPASFQPPSAAQHASSAPEAHAPSVASAAEVDAQSSPAAVQRPASARSAASAKRRFRENRGAGVPVAPERCGPRARASGRQHLGADVGMVGVSASRTHHRVPPPVATRVVRVARLSLALRHLVTPGTLRACHSGVSRPGAVIRARHGGRDEPLPTGLSG